MMKYTLKYSVGGIVPLLILTGLMSGVAGFNFSNTATAESIVPPSTSIPKPSSPLPKNIVKRLLKDASKRLGVPVRQLKLFAKPKIFPNYCVFNFGKICPRIYKPIKGWVVVVRGRGKSITYHVAKNGKFVADPKAK
ncbi:MAG: hypothetical protein QNJ63_09610 [Calothrix sp. MO_192.B10]|nr:hypothetical protein [Calothrix sp. MO_192.B10]